MELSDYLIIKYFPHNFSDIISNNCRYYGLQTQFHKNQTGEDLPDSSLRAKRRQLMLPFSQSLQKTHQKGSQIRSHMKRNGIQQTSAFFIEQCQDKRHRKCIDDLNDISMIKCK